MRLLTFFEYTLLKAIARTEPLSMSGSAYDKSGKLSSCLGHLINGKLYGKTVIDFGCGEGNESIGMARAGAAKVIGLDIRQSVLRAARLNSLNAGTQDICKFGVETDVAADIIVSIDSFEHFSDPEKVLRTMHSLLVPGGFAYISFGPTWYHPLGGHLFSIFPWSHIIFSEEALIRWRSDIRSDGATKFSEVEGGLNQITISDFIKLIDNSPFSVESLDCIPMRKLQRFHCKITREFTTSVVRCVLKKSIAAVDNHPTQP